MRDATDLDIALVGPAYPYRGGIAHFNEKMQEVLDASGVSSTIFTFTRQYPQLLFPGKSQEAPAGSDAAVAASRSIDTLNPISWIRTARRLGDRNPSAVLFHYWMPFFGPAFGTIARRCRRRGARILALVHNALPHEHHPGDRALARYFLNTVDAFIVLSEKVESDLRTLDCHQPARHVPHPTYDRFGAAPPKSVARERLGLPADAPVLLFFGFVRHYKGLQTLLSAMPSILESQPNTHLLVAGEFYDNESKYRRTIADAGLMSHVHVFSDYIPDGDVPTFFSAADVVVQPYLSATQSGVAQLAFSFNRPVITTDVGGLRETIRHGETGLIVQPDAPGALARAVSEFFEQEMAETMSANVAKDKDRFGWQPLLDAVIDLAGLPARDHTRTGA